MRESRKNLLFAFMILWWGVVLSLGCSNAGSDKEAHKLFSQASQLVEEAQKNEGRSYLIVFQLYQKALEKLERITAEYPKSEVAIRLTQGKAMLDPYTFAEFKGTILPQAKMRADAEVVPLACAFLAAQEVEWAPYKAKALKEIADRYAKLGEYEQAYQTAQHIEPARYKAEALAELASRYVGVGQKDKASEMLSPALQAAQAIKVPYDRVGGLVQIASRYVELGERDKASEILSQALQATETMEYPCPKARALHKIAEGYAEMGQRDKTSALLSQALKVAKTIKGANDKAGTLAKIAGEYAKIEEYHQARLVAKLIENAPFKPIALCGIADGYVEAGEKGEVEAMLARALRAAKTIMDPHAKDQAFAQIAERYVRGGQYSRALQVAKLIEHPPIRAKALDEVAMIYAQMGEEDKASAILSQALQVAKIAIGYVALGRYNQALQISNSMEYAPIRSWALYQMALNCADAGGKVGNRRRGFLHEIIREVAMGATDRNH